MDYQIEKVINEDDILNLSLLAAEIYREHFTRIIGSDQVEYMIEKFQSKSAIQKQIADGYRYYSLKENGFIIGYFAIVFDGECSAQLSKIYVKGSKRGLGLGDKMLGYILEDCRKNGIIRLFLVVNKKNEGPVKWYENRGFKIAGELKKDIGSGFFMDDFLMEKEIIYKKTNLKITDEPL